MITNCICVDGSPELHELVQTEEIKQQPEAEVRRSHHATECQFDLRHLSLMTRHSQLLPEEMLWFSTSLRRGRVPSGLLKENLVTEDLHPPRVF